MDPRILVLAAATFAIGTQTYAFTGSLAPLAASLGITLPTAGQMVMGYGVAFAIAGPVLAALFGPTERRRLLVIALVVVAALNVAAAFAPDFGTLLRLRVATALAASLVNPLAAAVAVVLAPPERRGKALALVLGGLTVAFVAGIPFGSVVADLWNWRATFLFGAAVTAGAALTLVLTLPRLPGSPGPALSGLGDALRPRVLHTLALSLIAFCASFPVVAYLGPVITAVTGLEGSRLAALQTLVGIGSVAGVSLGGLLADRPRGFAIAPLLFLGIGATQIGYALLLEGWMAPGTLATALLGSVIFLSAASQFALFPLIQARIVAQAGDGRHVALALNGSLIMLGQGIGAAIGGVAQSLGGFPAMGFAGACASLLGAAVALLALRPGPAVVTLPSADLIARSEP